MGLLERIAARRLPVRAWPVGKAELVAPDYAYGHDQSQFSPEEYGDYLATSNDIYSIVALRARLMSRLKLRMYRGRDADKIEDGRSAASVLYRRVNPFWTRPRLDRMDEMSMGVWGETFWALERPNGRRRDPGEIWWLKPSRVHPVPDESGYLSGFKYHSVSGQILHFDPDEIVWFRYPNPLDEFSPLSPLAAARLAADTSAAAMQSAKSLHANGLQIAGIIVPPADKVTFSTEQAETLERDLTRRLSGPSNKGRWAVLRYEAQFKQLQISPKDAESTAQMQMSFRQACRAYGMPPELLAASENATLANVREFERMAWDNTLISDAEFRAAEIEEQFLTLFRGGPDHAAPAFDEIAALQESATESWTREAQALDRGAITINEWRSGKGMPPVPWGEKPWLPVNKAPVGADGALELPAAAPASLPDDEVNPSNAAPQTTGEKTFDHMAARRLLATLTPLNGLNGVRL